MFADQLFQPGIDPGLIYDRRPEAVLVPVRGAKVRQVSACESEEANRYVRRRIEERWRWPVSPPLFRVASSLVTLEDAEYRNNGVTVGGKFVLSGAAGNRVWTRQALKTPAGEQEAEFAEIARRRQPARIAVRGATAKGHTRLPFAVDLRNGYNFYHFLTEGLPQLSVIARAESLAPIHVHMPKLADLKGFVARFIETIYPELSGRIVFLDERTRYDAVRAVYQHRHYLYQIEDPEMEAALAGLPADDPWRALSATPASRGFVAKSSVDDGQALLGPDGRARIAAAGLRDWPERVLIMRDPASGARDRRDQGAARFIRNMTDLGFEVMYLERMSPLEQMALWAGAGTIVSPHGAAFAHMFFASADTEAIEIGTPQTQSHRWGDFLQNAHVSRCKYTTVFSDVSRVGRSGKDAEAIAPPMAEGHLGISFSDRVVEAIEERIGTVAEAG